MSRPPRARGRTTRSRADLPADPATIDRTAEGGRMPARATAHRRDRHDRGRRHGSRVGRAGRRRPAARRLGQPGRRSTRHAPTRPTRWTAILAAVADGRRRAARRPDGAAVGPAPLRLSREPPPTLTGYELANVVEVTVRDLARLGDVDRRHARGRGDEHGQPVVPGRRPGAGRTRGAAAGDGRGPGPGRRPGRGGRAGDRRRVGHRRGRRRPVRRCRRRRPSGWMVAADAATPVEAGSIEVAVSVTVTYRAR